MSKIPNGEYERLEPYQIDIYNGLKILGEDIADFYLDGIKIYHSNEFKIKSNLLALCAREIDDEIREILSSEKERKIIQKELEITPNLKKKLNNKGRAKNQTGHLSSIITALNCDLDSEFAIEWITVANKFHRYAHRDKKRRKIRDPLEFIELWERYERILSSLVGTYYNFLDRVDRILNYEEPTREILNTLDSLFENHALYVYFFANLNSSKWLKPLIERGYFDLDKIPKRYELHDRPGTFTNPPWIPLIYLKKLIIKNKVNPNDNITEIIIEIVNTIIYNFDSIDNNWIDLIILEVISNFPADKIEYKHIEFIRTLLTSSNRLMVRTDADIDEFILPSLINGQRCDLILQLLDIIFDFKPTNFRPDPIMDEFWLKRILIKYKDSILKLCSVETADIILKKLKKITNLYPNFSIRAIEDNQQNILDYNSLIVHFLRDIFEFSEPKYIKAIISNLMEENASIF